MYDQNPILWNARIHNTDGRLAHKAPSSKQSHPHRMSGIVFTTVATALVVGSFASWLVA